MKYACTFLVSLIACTTMPGCASVKVRPLSCEGDYKEGVLFYAPAPYLLIANGKEGEVTATIVMLPDKSRRPRNITWSNGWFGKAEPKFNLAGGWNLTAFDSKADSGFSDAVAAFGELIKVAGERGLQKVSLPQLLPIMWSPPADGVPGKWRIIHE